MKKFWIQITALTIIIFAGFYFYSNQPALYTFLPNAAPTNLKELKVGENTLKVEIADTSDKRQKGLSGRQSLASDSGMLFVFTESKIYTFWMKGMLIPLDFIYINSGKVVDLLKNIQPPAPNQPDSELSRINPVESVDMVLEVNSGYIDSHNIKIGDSVSLIK